MPVWQFLILTVLLVGVLACAAFYARVLGRTLSRANARLKRIEDALVVANDRLLKRSESVAAPPGRANSSDGESARYLSILDLKVDSQGASYSGRGRNPVAVPVSPESVRTLSGRTIAFDLEAVQSFVAGDTLVSDRDSMGSELPSSTTLQPVSENCVAKDATVSDPIDTSSQVSVPAAPAEGVAAEARADSERPRAVNATSSSDNASSNGSHSRDSVAKQKRDALLILNSQRRRRRARLGH